MHATAAPVRSRHVDHRQAAAGAAGAVVGLDEDPQAGRVTDLGTAEAHVDVTARRCR